MADHGAIGVNLTLLPNPPAGGGGGGEVQGTFTANSVLLETFSNTFSADAQLSLLNVNSFTANAYIVPETISGTSIIKRTTLHILRRREIEFGAYIPPRVPDEEEEDGGLPDPICLPPCQGVGIGYGAMGGPERRTITRCTACDNYFRTESEYLGRGSPSLDGNYHCGSCGSHQRDSHHTRLFVDYLTTPPADFRMRARLYWDQGTSSTMSVNVNGNVSALPTISLDDCADELDVWNDGDYLGSMVFIADREGTLGGRLIQYQDEPSDIVINGPALSTTIFRFTLADQFVSANAKFKAANVAMIVD